MLCNFNKIFFSDEQKKSLDSFMKKAIEEKSCITCKYAKSEPCGYYMNDIYCYKKNKFLVFQYNSPCAAYQFHPDLVIYGSAAQRKEEG
jgi:hypothetical protein